MTEQLFSMRQSMKDMSEISDAALRVAQHKNKFRRVNWDDEEIALQANLISSGWLTEAKGKNPLRPLGPALDLARLVLRELDLHPARTGTG